MYTVDWDDEGLKIYAGSETAPFVLQPHWPDGTPWESEEQARTWAAVLIDSLGDATKPMPGNNPAEPTRPAVAPDPAPWEIDPNFPNPLAGIE